MPVTNPGTDPLNLPAESWTGQWEKSGTMVLKKLLPKFAQRPTINPLYIGLQLAKLADLPADVLSEAARVTELMEEKHSALKASSETGRIAQRRKVFLRVMITSSIHPLPSLWPFVLIVHSRRCFPLPSRAAPDTTHSGV